MWETEKNYLKLQSSIFGWIGAEVEKRKILMYKIDFDNLSQLRMAMVYYDLI